MKLIFVILLLLTPLCMAVPSWAGEQEAELAKKLQNPVADLVSVPLQHNWDFSIGPEEAMRYTLNVQPVIPISISRDWNVIIRTIMPVIHAESPVRGGGTRSGLGDVLQSFFFSPKALVGGWVLGAGPTAVVLRQESGWTYGMLANHVWSYAGDSGREDVSATFLQPFVSYTTKTYTTFLVNTESTYDWVGNQWTVPVNVTVSQLLKIGGLPISLGLDYRSYVKRPDGGPDWGVRFITTFLFPKK